MAVTRGSSDLERFGDSGSGSTQPANACCDGEVRVVSLLKRVCCDGEVRVVVSLLKRVCCDGEVRVVSTADCPGRSCV